MIKVLIALSLLLNSCMEEKASSVAFNTEETITPEEKKYWYNNDAEITSYELSQARYGEAHKGKAVLIYVTEPFSTQTFTKADRATEKDISVLKLNFTKKFNTGIYPYSMMTSTFFPFENGKNSLKISSSSQEWCGHTFMELNNKKKYEVQILSYFQGEPKDNLKLEKELLEDDFWTMIRLAPQALPLGKIKVIPSFFALRLLHKDIQAYTCNTTNLVDGAESVYTMTYPELERTLTIRYEKEFPHKILSWKEESYSGFGSKRKKLTTTAKRIKTIKSAYWKKNSNKDLVLRTELGLD